MPLDAETRTAVRALIDEIVRSRVTTDGERCVGCGMPREDWTPGCRPCGQRHNQWRRRGDPRYSEALHRRVQQEWIPALENEGRKLGRMNRWDRNGSWVTA